MLSGDILIESFAVLTDCIDVPENCFQNLGCQVGHACTSVKSLQSKAWLSAVSVSSQLLQTVTQKQQLMLAITPQDLVLKA